MTKQLEKDSNFNQFDTDHDGVVTDAELARSERRTWTRGLTNKELWHGLLLALLLL